MVISLIICLVSVITLVVILWVRNNQTHAFRLHIIDLFYDNFYDDKNMMRIYQNKASYNKMFLSFKRLALDQWFTPGVVEKLKSVDNKPI
jgi:hypothetical protein